MNIFEDYMTPLDRKEEARAVASILEQMMPPCASNDEGEVNHMMPSLAMVYSPEQYWRNIYEPCEALDRGTLFSELYFPLDREKGWRQK